ncbi:Crp/Fnr family transcriptional regulator [Streptomyces sp. V3I8]|uniref:Crp/Fnr family transcriptional regulator n=1 Tax=Streptomyces sp. V3I8 TaxID=3042279 RepID=UPI0027D8FA35|nr:Crp/Fnr family transcriptional regulator [Streptomyces sp. V3I8]
MPDRTFLEALDTEARKDLLRISAERAFRPGEHLLLEQDDSTHVLVLLEGWAVVSTATDRSSARLILALRRRGELIGEMAVLGSVTRTATVTALGPVRALVVSGSRFRAFAGRDPRVGALLMAQLVARLRSSDEERRSLASLTVMQRVAAKLLELGELQSAPDPGHGHTGTAAGSGKPPATLGPVPGARARGFGGGAGEAGGRERTPGGAEPAQRHSAAAGAGAHLARTPGRPADPDGPRAVPVSGVADQGPAGAHPPGDESPVLAELAQHDLADAVGATREAVAKSLRLLRGAGVVRTRPRRIELIDRDALRLLAAGGNIGFPAR